MIILKLMPAHGAGPETQEREVDWSHLLLPITYPCTHPASQQHHAQCQSLLFSCESCLHNPWVSLQMIAFCFSFRFYTASLFGIRVGLHSVFNMSREVVTQQLSNNIQLKATTETEVKPIYIQLAEE